MFHVEELRRVEMCLGYLRVLRRHRRFTKHGEEDRTGILFVIRGDTFNKVWKCILWNIHIWRSCHGYERVMYDFPRYCNHLQYSAAATAAATRENNWQLLHFQRCTVAAPPTLLAIVAIIVMAPRHKLPPKRRPCQDVYSARHIYLEHGSEICTCNRKYQAKPCKENVLNAELETKLLLPVK